MKSVKNILLILVVVSSIALAGCGSGGGGDTPAPTPKVADPNKIDKPGASPESASIPHGKEKQPAGDSADK